MKHALFIIFTCIFLAACGTSAKEETKKEPAGEVDKAKDEEMEKKKAEETGGTPVTPQYRVNEGTWSIEPIADAPAKAVLLTIDDAPDKHALEMAKTLKRLNAPAVFFVNGHFIESEEGKQKLKEIAEMGFAIGNHTYSHNDLKTLSENEQREEIIKVNDLVEEITGERPRFFRAPFGSNTDFSRKLAKEQGMALMNWTYGYDWEKDYQTKESLADIMVNTPLLKNGANLLMHDREWTSGALENIAMGLKSKGYDLIDPKTIKSP